MLRDLLQTRYARAEKTDHTSGAQVFSVAGIAPSVVFVLRSQISLREWGAVIGVTLTLMRLARSDQDRNYRPRLLFIKTAGHP